jgi:hypothetical protein
MSQRDDDLRMLNDLLGKEIWEMRDAHDSLTAAEVEAFASMRVDLTVYPSDIAERHGFEKLTDKQRAWVKAVHERVTGGSYENLASRGLVARGKEVPSMVGPLPKRPPPLPRPTAPQRASAEHRPFRAMGLDEKDEE